MNSSMPLENATVCRSCGACCASYRVSFYWAEAAALGLDDRSVEKLNAHLLCMRGTNQVSPRCVALTGEVGQTVTCSQYERRPSPCHDVQPGDAKCLQARRQWGLPAMAPC